MALLSIDPGVSTGWAVYNSSHRLYACGLGVPDLADDPDEVVIECEELRGRGEKNPNSIALMMRNAGEWFGRYQSVAPCRYIRVADWKGNTPKHIDHRRTLSKLSADELKALEAGCRGVSPRSKPLIEAVAEPKGLSKADKRANILDAVGIGLYAVGR